MSSSTYLMRPRPGRKPPTDVEPGSDWSMGAGIAQCLQTKGYCLITGLVAEEDVELAKGACADEVDWCRPAPLIQEGLLGAEGSCQIAKIARESNAGGEFHAAMHVIDGEMSRLCDAVGLYQDTIGFRCSSRSVGYLHQAGSEDQEEMELTDDEANEFAAIFASRKIMVMVFLGPSAGTLDLQPYDEDANAFELLVAPGSAVILRTDQLSCSLCAPGRDDCFVASCFMLQPDVLKMHRQRMEEHLTPAARNLDAWIEERLREIKETEPVEQDWEEIAVPRNFTYAANRMWFTRNQTAVHGMSARFPATWESELAFLSCVHGADVSVEIPFMRWDHSTIYDPDPECWRQDPPRTNCRHCSFMDGIELFDNKIFGLVVQEVRSMDPCQRLCLETTYDALNRAGYSKKDIHNSTCGMYVGMGSTEWSVAERTADVGTFGATGGAPSICAGRLSFCLGCRGASIAIDAEAASSLASTFWAAESVEHKGGGRIQEMACAIGVHLCIAKHWWPAHTASGFLSPKGRCLSFDQSASGYLRGEGCGTIVLKDKNFDVDAEDKVQDDSAILGIISGGAIGNNGASAGLYAPHGPGEQMVLLEACRKSGITPRDVDAVECFANGMFLRDAIEVASCAKALRDSGTDTPIPTMGLEHEMLQLGSAKTNMGNLVEASGILGLVKLFHSIRWNLWAPNQHIRQLNPHLDLAEVPVLIGDEATDPRSCSLFVGHSSFGFGGTNVHIHAFGGANEDLRPPPGPTPESLRPKLAFWPGGGGESARPQRGYFILGTWGGLEGQPEPMEYEGVGVYGFTMTLGENRWEQFQLVLDADLSQMLHPLYYKAGAGSEVLGPHPEEEAAGCTWLLDGRSSLPPAAAMAVEGAIQQADGELNEDAGMPGDLYRIRLHTAGKWRTVSWSRITDGRTGRPPPGSFFVVGAWSGFEPEPLEPDGSEPGVHTACVALGHRGGEFVIVRDKDWRQTLSPERPRCGLGAEAFGPDDRGDGSWLILGRPFDRFRIELRRAAHAFEVSWRRTEDVPGAS